MMNIKSYILAAAFLLIGMGCEWSSDGPSITFYNKSSYTVTVTPTGTQSWKQFTIAPGKDYELSSDDPVYFIFQPMNFVDIAKQETGMVIFINDGEYVYEAE